VVALDDHKVQLHSTAVKYVAQEEERPFLDVLKSYGDNTWWKIMHCDEDGEWIRRAIRMGTLVISHDGSYMPDTSSTVSGAGILTHCTSTGNSLKIGLAEKSESASSYRGEILGGILAQLILRAATGGTACKNCEVKVHCDNRGVLSHGRDKDMRLKENQSQADALMCMKKLTRSNAAGTKHVWAKAHVKKERGKRKTMSQEHNDMDDELAKISLRLGVETGCFAASELPLEDVWLTREGKKDHG
jgi:hypothetical protein